MDAEDPPFFLTSHRRICVDRQQRHTRTETQHNAPPVCAGGVATQQLSRAAYGVSNWVEQHSWTTPTQDLASGNQSHNPQHIHAPPCEATVGGMDGGWCGVGWVVWHLQQQTCSLSIWLNRSRAVATDNMYRFQNNTNIDL